jgi:hypothetical protein
MNIVWFPFVMDTKCVFCKVGIEFLNVSIIYKTLKARNG